jgi:hypothetical protein
MFWTFLRIFVTFMLHLLFVLKIVTVKSVCENVPYETGDIGRGSVPSSGGISSSTSSTLNARKFRCRNSCCTQRIFTERFPNFIDPFEQVDACCSGHERCVDRRSSRTEEPGTRYSYRSVLPFAERNVASATVTYAIEIHELGTSVGTESSVKVENPSGRIRVRIRHPDTLLQVGCNRHRNTAAEYNVEFREQRNNHSNTARERLA